MNGKAELEQANYTRQTLIAKAKAEKEAAVLQAEAIAIVGEAAQKYPEYRMQQLAQDLGDAMQTNPNIQLMFIPTENGLPLIVNPIRGN